MKIIIFFSALILILAFTISSCKRDKQDGQTSSIDYSAVKTPAFNADSAYSYVKKQCDFGPRTPMSKASKECAKWIVDFLKANADTVYVQDFQTTLWDGSKAEGKNIIASFNLESTDRVLFCSHWDSRQWADNDEDSSLQKTPIVGANDGASGVGILLEIARLMKSSKTKQGLDIVLFDLEDQGTPTWAESDIEDQKDWCLGSQYWAQNPHIPFYTAKYGVLLDMVGAETIRFTKEYASMQYAPSIMDNIWTIASDLGYGNIFANTEEGSVMDDHIWVNQYAKIPTIDIVNNSQEGSFFPYWHTSKDDLSCISSKSLAIVGKVLLVSFFAAE